MRIKLNLFLQVFVIVTIFFIGGCGENGEQKETTQAASALATLTDEEQENMNAMLYNILGAVKRYSVDLNHNRFPPTQAEMEEYRGKPIEGYEVNYEVTEKDGIVEEFVITIFNPSKTHKVSFKSSCYKESGNCVKNYQNRSINSLLEGIQVKPVE